VFSILFAYLPSHYTAGFINIFHNLLADQALLFASLFTNFSRDIAFNLITILHQLSETQKNRLAIMLIQIPTNDVYNFINTIKKYLSENEAVTFIQTLSYLPHEQTSNFTNILSLLSTAKANTSFLFIQLVTTN
jgi:hypothetical protein